MRSFHLLLAVLVMLGCGKSAPQPADTDDTMYFPPIAGSGWETVSPSSLGWNQGALASLKQFLAQTNTKSFLILVNGRIVIEEYFNGHTANAQWEWNSAGKTLVATTTGIAQQEGLLGINDKASDYLGTGWTNMHPDKEKLITIRHLLTMTSGIDDSKQLVIKPNLTYLADAGTRWAYGNVFQKLTDIVEEASNQNFEAYFDTKLKNKIGMNGYWNFGVIFTIYHSDARSMARFGLLALNKGKWKEAQIVDEAFFNESTQSSQSLNPSYGYLWWLNGKPKYMLPTLQDVFTGPLVPNAPSDMYAAMGAFDQRLYIIPGRKMVVVRMGNAGNPDNPEFAVSGYDNELWAKINAVIN